MIEHVCLNVTMRIMYSLFCSSLTTLMNAHTYPPPSPIHIDTLSHTLSLTHTHTHTHTHTRTQAFPPSSNLAPPPPLPQPPAPQPHQLLLPHPHKHQAVHPPKLAVPLQQCKQQRQAVLLRWRWTKRARYAELRVQCVVPYRAFARYVRSNSTTFPAVLPHVMSSRKGLLGTASTRDESLVACVGLSLIAMLLTL